MPDDERNSIESAASIRQPVQLRIVTQLIARSLETTDSMGKQCPPLSLPNASLMLSVYRWTTWQEKEH